MTSKPTLTQQDVPEEEPENVPNSRDDVPGDALEATAIHEVLSNERRRLLLLLLTEGRGVHTLRELSERIAERESGESPAPRDLRQSVYVSLQQTHVPKLVRLGIVEYEGGGSTVVLTNRADDVTVHLEPVSGYELSWSEYYLGVGLLGVLTVVASLVGVPVLARVSPGAWGIVFLCTVILSAAYHTRTFGSTVFHRVRDG